MKASRLIGVPQRGHGADVMPPRASSAVVGVGLGLVGVLATRSTAYAPPLTTHVRRGAGLAMLARALAPTGFVAQGFGPPRASARIRAPQPDRLPPVLPGPRRRSAERRTKSISRSRLTARTTERRAVHEVLPHDQRAAPSARPPFLPVCRQRPVEVARLLQNRTFRCHMFSGRISPAAPTEMPPTWPPDGRPPAAQNPS